MRYNEDPHLGPERLAHLTAEEYVRLGHISENEFKALFKFSFVRNPWERLVSEYHYQKYDQGLSFGEFVRHGFPRPGLSNAYRHVIPQYDYLYNTEGEILVDFVGKFESLQKDFDFICQKLNIENSNLPHGNSTRTIQGSNSIKRFFDRGKRAKKEHYSLYYDAETKTILDNIYRKDIDTFGYHF